MSNIPMCKQVVFPAGDYLTGDALKKELKECKLSIDENRGDNKFSVLHGSEVVRKELFDTLPEAREALVFEASRMARISRQFDDVLASF